MAELGTLHISPDPESLGSTVLNEIIFRKEAVPFPKFGYMDSTLSVVIRFNEPITSVDDLLDGDPLNVTSYEIAGVRVLTVLLFSTTEVRLILNQAPVYAPNTFVIRVTANGIEDFLTVLSIEARPEEVSTIATDTTDIRVNLTGSRAGSAECVGGDYALSGTLETIKKLVYEIMLVQLGEMLHDPTFGNRVRLKGLQNTADLIEQGRDLRSRIMLIPQVDSCVISTKYGDGTGSETVIFTAKVKTKSGTELTVNSVEGI